MEGTSPKDLCTFLLSKEQFQVQLFLKFEGCINRGLAQGDLLGSPLISLYLAQKWMAAKIILFFLGSEVLRVTLRHFKRGLSNIKWFPLRCCFITHSSELVHSLGNFSEILVHFKSKPYCTALEAKKGGNVEPLLVAHKCYLIQSSQQSCNGIFTAVL